MANTRIIVANVGNYGPLPGVAWTPASIINQFSADIPNIGSMSVEESFEGEDKVFTFRPKTGTKGLLSKCLGFVTSVFA